MNIYIGENNIGIRGTEYIADAIKKAKITSIINLRDNDIGEQGAKYIAEAIIKTQEPLDIQLSENNLGDSGVAAIFEGLGLILEQFLQNEKEMLQDKNQDSEQNQQQLLYKNMMQNTPSMIANFPDGIECGVDYNDRTILFLIYANNNRAYYRYIWHGGQIEVVFNLDGTYSSGVGSDRYIKGCLGQSIQQLYNQDRAFNLVNSPEQVQQLQRLEEKIHTQEQKTQKLENENKIQKEENNLLKDQIEKIIQQSDTKFELLEENIEKSQKAQQTLQEKAQDLMSGKTEEQHIKIESHECFEKFNEKDIKMCFNKTDMQVVLPEELNQCTHSTGCMSLASWTIERSSDVSEDDYLTICLEKFSERGANPCNETECDWTEPSGKILKGDNLDI